MARIFLCHASEDKPQVREVYQRLQAEGLEPWLDEEDLIAGQLWEHEIPKALKASTLILIFFSQHAVDKEGYIQRELRLAIDAWQEIPEGRIHTIPLRLDDCSIPSQFRRFHYIDLSQPGWENRLLRSVRFGLEERGQPAPEPVASEPPIAEPGVAPSQPIVVVEPEPPAAAIVPPQPGELEEWTNSIGMIFVRIPAGSFLMGSPDSDAEAFDDEKPAHRVEITQPFYLGKYPITQGQWEAVMGDNPSRFQGNPNRPVERVSWEDVQRFMATLNERDGGSHYGLPTEAQWEYACRAGTEGSRYHTDIEAIAWYHSNSGGETHAVGEKQPNTWGLHDMLGNVYEWCHDGRHTYTDAAVVDPEGRTSAGAVRVIRGGSWGYPARYVRAASRNAYEPGLRYSTVGFRCLSSGREPGRGAQG